MSINADVPLWLSLVFILGGLYVLAKSADAFVDSASAVARRFGISPLIVGMVIIGFGTSAPELAVSAISASGGHPGLSLGNAYGSCAFNIAVILGLAAVIRPIVVKSSVTFLAAPALALLAALSYLLLSDGTLSRSDGLVLLAFFAVAMPLYCWYDQRASGERRDAGAARSGGRAIWIECARLLAGLVLLVASSHVFVWGCVDFARDILGVSDLLIGLTIVAAGTSLPELASAIASVRRGESEFVIGNIVGSNLFNMLAVVGIASSISPFGGFSRFVQMRDVPVVFALSLMISVFGLNLRNPRSAGAIRRWEGGLLLLSFFAYAVMMVLQELAES